MQLTIILPYRDMSLGLFHLASGTTDMFFVISVVIIFCS